jgi:mRNA-degrading endonuclease RelE of RelBE toxin-antitoxin system
LHITKVTGTKYLRAKKGKFRVIFKYNADGDIDIKYVRTRNERTYKNI